MTILVFSSSSPIDIVRKNTRRERVMENLLDFTKRPIFVAKTVTPYLVPNYGKYYVVDEGDCLFYTKAGIIEPEADDRDNNIRKLKEELLKKLA
jgi:hypothetical protein